MGLDETKILSVDSTAQRHEQLDNEIQRDSRSDGFSDYILANGVRSAWKNLSFIGWTYLSMAFQRSTLVLRASAGQMS
jgi:hypothetical protein